MAAQPHAILRKRRPCSLPWARRRGGCADSRARVTPRSRPQGAPPLPPPRIEAATSAPTTGARIGGSWWQRVARERSCGGGRSRSAASERQHARQPSTCRLGRPLGRFAGGGAGGQPQRTPVVATHASTRRETGCRGCARYGRVRDGRSCARNGTRARAAIFRQRPETQDAHT